MMAENVVLIGMPGAGKSTVGVVLAKRLGLGFVDTDLLIQSCRGLRLHQIIEKEGIEGFLRLEETVLRGLTATGSVVATGGSAVYSEAAMASLKRSGTIVYLDIPLGELEKRVQDMALRGVVIAEGKTLGDLYRERVPLYRKHAELIADGAKRSVEEVAAEIESLLKTAKGT